jgi:hypothetical protein
MAILEFERIRHQCWLAGEPETHSALQSDGMPSFWSSKQGGWLDRIVR